MKLKKLKHRLSGKKLKERQKKKDRKMAQGYYKMVWHRVTISEVLFKLNRY